MTETGGVSDPKTSLRPFMKLGTPCGVGHAIGAEFTVPGQRLLLPGKRRFSDCVPDKAKLFVEVAPLDDRPSIFRCIDTRLTIIGQGIKNPIRTNLQRYDHSLTVGDRTRGRYSGIIRSAVVLMDHQFEAEPFTPEELEAPYPSTFPMSELLRQLIVLRDSGHVAGNLLHEL